MEILADPITVNCRKVLAGLKLIGADYTLTKVDYFKGEQKNPEFMNHRWWYFPRMTPEQALLLKTYDSETDGRARFMSHTAFEDPDTPPNALTRQSIEVRTMAFF